jgi:hypothetical protein
MKSKPTPKRTTKRTTKRTAKRTAKKRSAATARSGEGADPRFEPVVKALAKSPGFTLMESKSGAMRGLMRDGKSFGMSQHGRFIVKLEQERVADLIARGVGKPFSPGAGRVMKGWIEVTDPKANWVWLGTDAYRAAGKPREVIPEPEPTSSRRSKSKK